jgi:hypothetical protein
MPSTTAFAVAIPASAARKRASTSVALDAP